MISTAMSNTLIRRLDDGLILRHATPADADELAEFNARIHSDAGPDQPEEPVGIWTRDLLTRPHPTMQPADFTVVEDTNTGKIVSSMNLIPQTWSYAGIPFAVGRPELVGTAPEYRNRGLVRAQFDVIHAWCEQRGLPVQAITGIPYYYRIFGYEMTVDLGGGRVGYKNLVPRLKEDEQEPYSIRPALETDIPFLTRLYDQSSARYLLHCQRDQELWRYEISGKSDKNVNRSRLMMIDTLQGQPVGFFDHPISPWGPTMIASIYELAAGVSWAAVTPSVIRYLFDTGLALAKEAGKEDEFNAFGFWMGRQHPVYEVLHDRLPRIRKPYSWYLRIPNLPGFLQRITPVLESRLAESNYPGHSGELTLTFYTTGLRFVFEDGRINEISTWQPKPVGHSGNAAFPGLTFLQVLFGHRSLDELAHIFPDCYWENELAYGLLNSLFPVKPSSIWMLS